MATRSSYDESLFSTRGRDLRAQDHETASIVEEVAATLRAGTKSVPPQEKLEKQMREDLFRVVRRRRREAAKVALFDLETLQVEEDCRFVQPRFLNQFLALLPREARLIAQARRLDYSWGEIASAHGQTVEAVQTSFRVAVDATLSKMQADPIH